MLHILENRTWQFGILPQTGASIAFGRIRRGDGWQDLLRPTAEQDYDQDLETASYLLVPWCNRLKDARFQFNHTLYQLMPNFGDGTAIHGTARSYPWRVETADRERISMSFLSSDHTGVNFPFRFSSRVEYRLEGADLVARLSVRNEDHRPMPAGIGHHPYFLRAPGGLENEVQIEIPCDEQFLLEKNLPSGQPVPLTAELDFRTLRPPGDKLIDDVFTGRRDGQPVRLVYPDWGLTISMHADLIFQHVVLYAPPGRHFIALEPVSNVNDGFNLYERGISGTGVFVLEPGAEKSGTVRLRVEK